MIQPRFYSPLSYTALTGNVPQVAFTVNRHRATTAGGPMDAEILASGNEDELIALYNLLAYGVELVNDEGEVVWWGRVNEVRVTIGASVVGWTMDAMYNDIKVAYSLTDPVTGTSGERRTTTSASDTYSQSLFGIKELLQTLTSATATQAASLRTMLLDRYKLPVVTIEPAGGGTGAPKARLLCVGWYETMRNRYANISIAAPGYTERPDSPNYSVVSSYGFNSENDGVSIGSSAASEKMAFDLPNTLTRPAVWKRIKIKCVRIGSAVDNLLIDLCAGTASAPGAIIHTITVDTATLSTTANTVYEFAPTSTVYRVPGQSYCVVIRRSGAVSAPNHVDVHGISPAANAGVETYVYNGTSWVLDAQDTFYEFTEEADNYFFDLNAVSARQRVAIPFTVTESTAVGSIKVPLAKVGAPTYDVLAYITVDSSGSPGAEVAHKAISATDLSADFQDALFDSLSATTLLTVGTTYWLQIWPNGSVDPANFIKVYANPALGYTGGDPKIYNGSAWVAASPNMDMLFQLGLVQETTTQIKNLATAYGQFITGVDIDTASGVWTNPARNGDVTAKTCIDEMLESGTSAGVRLLAAVNRERRLRIYAEPTAASFAGREYRLLRDGRLVNALDVPADKSRPQVGVWVKLRDLLPDAINQSLFIEEAEYMAERDSIGYTTRGAMNPMDMFKIQRG